MSDNIRKHRFIDGVGDIRIQDDIVRMDLMSHSPTLRDQNERLVPEFSGQLVMSPTAFMRMAKVLGMALSSMQEKGMISPDGLDRLMSGPANNLSKESDNDDTPPPPRKRSGGSPNFR